jgi:protein-tyrosine-phosphatase
MTASDMAASRPFRLLFLCTGNSARSQIAEALLQKKGHGRFIAGSAGSHPAPHVNPFAIQVLTEHGIEWRGRRPKSIDDVIGDSWDFVITVCDRAKESCSIFPGQPVFAHWGLPDPADATGTQEEKLRVFRETAVQLSRRIDLMLALPLEKLQRRTRAERLKAIGEESHVQSR